MESKMKVKKTVETETTFKIDKRDMMNFLKGKEDKKYASMRAIVNNSCNVEIDRHGEFRSFDMNTLEVICTNVTDEVINYDKDGNEI
jgi:hypothetical protein